MPNKPKKIQRPWLQQRAPFERERHANDFDYNGRKWRNLRKRILEANPLCVACKANGIVRQATVLDHEPQAKELIRTGRDPYDEQYLQPLCGKCHNSKSGRERHKGGMG